MQETAIIHRERINRKGDIKYFQIPIPGAVKKIIGIESSVFLLTPLPAPVETGGSSTGETGGTGTGETTTTNSCPNPGSATITELSNTVSGSVRTHVFQIGSAVNPTFQYSVAVYSVTVSVTAVDGDTPSSIATKLADAVNNTSLETWNQYGSNNNNYKPTASANGDQLTLTTDSQHQFAAWGTGSCTGEPPPPPPPPPPTVPVYDLLFTIKNNEKAGILSLQSPDATDIFYQAEVYRQDSNIAFGDYTSKNFLVVDEWGFGKKRIATDVLITTASPIIEAYYKDFWGVLKNMDINYMLNVFLWLEK